MDSTEVGASFIIKAGADEYFVRSISNAYTKVIICVTVWRDIAESCGFDR